MLSAEDKLFVEELEQIGRDNDFDLCDPRVRIPRLLAIIRRQELALEKQNKALDIFTCHKCSAKDSCELAFDHYNTNGDCLAEK